MNSMNSKQYSYKYKLLVVGSAGVGKTNLIQTVTEKPYRFSMDLEKHYQTTPINNLKITMIALNKIKVMLHIRQINKRSKYLSKSFSEADGIIFVYDANNPSSFEDLKSWISEINMEKQSPKAVKLLLANKIDLLDSIDNFDEVQEYAQIQGMKFSRASMKHIENQKESPIVTLLGMINENLLKEQSSLMKSKQRLDEQSTNKHSQISLKRNSQARSLGNFDLVQEISSLVEKQTDKIAKQADFDQITESSLNKGAERQNPQNHLEKTTQVKKDYFTDLSSFGVLTLNLLSLIF